MSLKKALVGGCVSGRNQEGRMVMEDILVCAVSQVAHFHV